MKAEYVEKGIPFLRSLNISRFNIKDDDLMYISKEFNKNLLKSELHTGDVVVVRTGIPGTCAVIPPQYNGANCSDLVIIRPHKGINPHFIAAFINFWGQKQIANAKVGAVQKHFNVGAAKDMTIFLPDNQDSIANYLTALNDKINNNQRIISTLESLSKTLYDYYFLQFDFPDEKGRPYKSSGGKMEYNAELGREIPAGWKVTPVSDLVDCNANTATAKAMEYPVNYLDTSNITQNIIDTIQVISTPAQLPSRARRIIKNNDIVISTVRPNLKHYGFIKCLNRKVILSTGYAVLSPKNQAYSSYIYQVVTSDEIQKTIDQIAQLNVSAYPSFNPSDLLNLKIAIPNCDDILYSFSGKLDKSYETISHKQQENRHLTALRDFLLPLLMNGQVGFKNPTSQNTKEAPYEP